MRGRLLGLRCLQSGRQWLIGVVAASRDRILNGTAWASLLRPTLAVQILFLLFSIFVSTVYCPVYCPCGRLSRAPLLNAWSWLGVTSVPHLVGPTGRVFPPFACISPFPLSSCLCALVASNHGNSEPQDFSMRGRDGGDMCVEQNACHTLLLEGVAHAFTVLSKKYTRLVRPLPPENLPFTMGNQLGRRYQTDEALWTNDEVLPAGLNRFPV